MRTSISAIKRFARQELAATAIECAVVISLLTVVSIAGIRSLGRKAQVSFSSVGQSITVERPESE